MPDPEAKRTSSSSQTKSVTENSFRYHGEICPPLSRFFKLLLFNCSMRLCLVLLQKVNEVMRHLRELS
ncbi:hypothetical protein P8452_09218 [Trifolium repens]|nr:hypothetical protein P8452_09218 [Trifolium repens]